MTFFQRNKHTVLIYTRAKAKFFGIASATAINFNEGIGEKTK